MRWSVGVESESFTYKLYRCQAECAVVTDPVPHDDDAVDITEQHYF